ncbi:hypothetical protein OMW55_02705 [Sphingomonas sp. BN140010]|uniref:Uncharacterized protein n=1 Tax=Sphingomonas arvum TaxID=2992113 RepID=A0ABT3JCB0_9SPHN|nr:hypothetical protein [Sphingomonas sp. BN140010]MCW3796717.1 hypothetical protein [Sphingomonas sp. BN140010]
MRGLDFSSWSSILSTLAGLALITLIGVGIRLLVMATIQQRRERENRQINERLKTLIAAYKTLGGSFTGELSVDPRHLRDLRRLAADDPAVQATLDNERLRRMRDQVEAAFSDIILLGTDEQVRLAAAAAEEMVAGRPVHTAELVVSLRNFIRQALDLDAITTGLAIPRQGPLRPVSIGGGKGGRGNGGGGGGEEGSRGGRGGGGGMAGAAGGGAGLGIGLAAGHDEADDHEDAGSTR